MHLGPSMAINEPQHPLLAVLLAILLDVALPDAMLEVIETALEAAVIAPPSALLQGPPASNLRSRKRTGHVAGAGAGGRSMRLQDATVLELDFARVGSPTPPSLVMIRTLAASLADLHQPNVVAAERRLARVACGRGTGAGVHGYVVPGEASVGEQGAGAEGVVIKIPHSSAGLDDLAREATLYETLPDAARPLLPRYYGSYRPSTWPEDRRACIVLEHVGDPLASPNVGTGFEALDLSQAQQLYADVVALHRAGVIHCDIAGRNIVLDKTSRPRLVDLSSAMLGHRCAGEDTCDELVSLRRKLPLPATHRLAHTPPVSPEVAQAEQFGTLTSTCMTVYR